jgi:hypothetical protein
MSSQLPQPYDTTLKTWVEEQPQEILPELLPGAVYQQTLNVEIFRPPLRTDKVFSIKYLEQDHILHIEFESGADADMDSRLLVYHAILYHKYKLPVISLIIYPFRVKMAESPLREMSGRNPLVTFHFSVLPLFTLDAEQYVREHIAYMYPVLPTMKGANRELIEQALNELAKLYRDDEVTLSQQLIWMELLLERTDTIPTQEKDEIRSQLSMYDPLWEEHPKVQSIRAESEAKGKLKGRLDASQTFVLDLVETRFPTLAEEAQRHIIQIKTVEALRQLAKQLVTVPDEATARWVLSTYAA